MEENTQQINTQAGEINQNLGYNISTPSISKDNTIRNLNKVTLVFVIIYIFIGLYDPENFIGSLSGLGMIFLIIYGITFLTQFKKQKNQDQSQNPELLLYKLNIKKLYLSSCVGIILSLIYFTFRIQCNFFEHQCNLTEKILNTNIVMAQTAYYGGVAIIFLISTVFLKKHKKFGIYIFSLGILLVLISFFLPADLYLPEYESSSNFVSLFYFSIKSAFLGGLITFGGSIIGVVIYFLGIIIGISTLAKSKNLLNN